MQVCRYAQSVGCNDCEYPFHNQCKKFLRIHARWLMRNILKTKDDAFKYQPVKEIGKYDVLWSRNEDVAKSAALQFALDKNIEVTPYTRNAAMDLVTNRTEEINSQVVYLHVTKAVGDQDAIIGLIESFVDITVRNGGKVAIYVDKFCTYKLKYKEANK